jgi:hypothetical protein
MGLTPEVNRYELTYNEIMDIALDAMGQTAEQWWAANGGWVEEYNDIHSAEEWWAYQYQSESGTIPVVNIMVKLDAPDTDNAVLFVSHYDSVWAGPGAGDDMQAVCAMLEVLRSQADNNALKNDIYCLFTDGEEDTMLGAHCFAQSNSQLITSADMVVNLDARGNSGGLLLFETSAQAYPFIDLIKKSGAPIVPFSLASAVYAQMDNWTDFTVILNNGGKGINLAAIDGYEDYHSAGDTFENLNKNTAYAFLKSAMCIADYTAVNSLDGLGSPAEAVYFPFLPGYTVLMTYPVAVAVTALGVISSVLWCGLALRRKTFRLSSAIPLGLLTLTTIASTIFFLPGSYLFSLPLLISSAAAHAGKRRIAVKILLSAAGFAALLLWVPILYLIWQTMILPMMG